MVIAVSLTTRLVGRFRLFRDEQIDHLEQCQKKKILPVDISDPMRICYFNKVLETRCRSSAYSVCS